MRLISALSLCAGTLRAKPEGVLQLLDSSKWGTWIYEHKHTRDTGHSGHHCPEILEDVNYNNKNYHYNRPQQNQGRNQQRPSLNTSGVVIYASAAKISFYIKGKKETFSFKNKTTQISEQSQHEPTKRTNRMNRNKQMWIELSKIVTAAQGGQDHWLKSPFLTKKDDPGHWQGRRRVRSTHHPWKTVPQHYQSHHLYWNRRSPHALPLWRWRNHNQRRQIIKDGWADYKEEVVWREKIVIHEEEAPSEPPTTPSSESQDDWENGESRLEDLKTPNTLPRGKLGSYPFHFNYLK